MKFILSPSKRQDSIEVAGARTQVYFSEDAHRIGEMMKKYSAKVLANRLSLSERLSHEVHNLWQVWQAEGTTPSIAMFQGDVYDGLDFSSMSDAEKEKCMNLSLINSAVYGVLRGSDGISPYRLDLNDKVKMGSKSLKVYWKDKVDEFDVETDRLVDLTSSEYTPLIPHASEVERIRIDFKEEKAGKLKTVSFFSKRARGVFARWMVQNEPTSFEDLKSFQGEGYTLNLDASSDSLLLFSRKGQ